MKIDEQWRGKLGASGRFWFTEKAVLVSTTLLLTLFQPPLETWLSAYVIPTFFKHAFAVEPVADSSPNPTASISRLERRLLGGDLGGDVQRLPRQ
ncbi:hypothetical protein NMY22_g10881 [Coprinellus aureogranulatus]|nr:hypothetical protein NMY22_g10881 [Coprinellus aureogranulatus]